ncbi:MAG: hypothetical protein CMH26_04000 [Micavibrio sp.]|nr:hypothetical protein [Micavibrio sp.]
MYSNKITLSVPLTPSRQADASDARKSMLRHDPDYQQNKQNNPQHQDEKQSLKDAEATRISIDALRYFLRKLINQRNSGPLKALQQAKQNKPHKSISSKEAPPLISAQAQRASHLYAHIAEAREAEQKILFETSDHDHIRKFAKIDLDHIELHKIYQLNEALKELYSANIHYLYLKDAENFMASIENAIEEAKIYISER